MLKIIAVAVVVLIAAVLVFALTKPDNFRVERATTIKAPPEKIFAVIMIFTRGAPGHPGRNWIQT